MKVTNINYFHLLIFLLFFMISIPVVVYGDGDNAITIVKVKLTEEHNLPMDGTKADSLTDNNGKSLELVEGISYSIERVTLSHDETSFKSVEGPDAFKTQIMTDKSGEASINQLPSGMYKVTEEPNERIQKVMEPIILELPLPQTNGAALSHVYLYPKSGVLAGGQIFTPPKEIPKIDKIPQTSGNLGSYSPIIWSLLFLGLMGIISLVTIRKNNKII